ncbi:MAG TPA: glycosyltransferase family 2 protein [Candidatus Peribacteraceae bacterium]|nr:glycosyltransferase family 2 protein [Candidatus Peribacteraceae bacterium]
MLSLLVPVLNEEGVIEETIRTLDRVLKVTGESYEIVVIDDGSTDDTPQILARLNLPTLRIVTHAHNRGYGSSMKTGIRQSKGEIIGTVDADGTYPLEAFGALLKEMQSAKADMVVGARTKKGVKIPLIRRPAKWIVNKLANTLAGIRIPDLNSGMRIFTRPLGEKFMHLYPQRFSFTITITLAALTNDYIVRYVPIDYMKRTGKSTLSSGMNGLKNFANFLGLIVRIVTYFRPLKFFIWPSMILMVLGFGTICYTLYAQQNISDSGMLMLLSGLQIGLFGLLAEAVVRSRNAS